MLLKAILLGFLSTIDATALEVSPRDDCNPCNPQGATGTAPPAIGPDLKSMYLDLLASVKDIHFRRRGADRVEIRNDGFCCRESLDCVKVQSLNIPMCYDKFTTNYAFPDGSFGSLTTGDYTQGKSQANLFNGQYTKEGGETGNIYADDPSAKPNTATLSIPPQWTATGVGSAIPASDIGSVVTTTGGTTAASTPTSLPAQTTTTSTAGAQNTAASSSTSEAVATYPMTDSTRSFHISLFMTLIYVAFAS